MVFSVNKKHLRFVSLFVLLSYATPSFAGFWELLTSDMRLMASAALWTGTAGLLGYAKYLQNRDGAKLDDLARDITAAKDQKLAQFMIAKIIGQRMLDLQNKPCVNEQTNNFIKPEQKVTPVWINHSRVWQPLVLWQSMTGEGFSGRNNSMEQAAGMAAGIKVAEVIKTMQQYTLGNGEAFKDYVQRADQVNEGSIAGGSLSCAYQSLKNTACLLRAIFAGDNLEQYDTSLEMLLDLPLSVNLFGKNPAGQWREKVIEMRKQQLLSWYVEREIGHQHFLIHEGELPAIDGSGIRPMRVRSIYQQIIGNLNKQKINQEVKIFERNDDGRVITINHSRENIIQAIQHNSQRYEREDNEQPDINEYLKRDEIISAYIKQGEDLELKINLDNEEFLQDLMAQYEEFRHQYHGEPVTLDGEDLNDQEFQNLIVAEKETNGLLFEFGNIPYDLIQNDLELDGDQGLIARLRHGLTQTNYCHVIFLHGDHHWLTLIISKCAGQVDYVIADSLNIPRYGARYVQAEVYQAMLVSSELTQRIWKIINATTSEAYVDLD